MFVVGSVVFDIDCFGYGDLDIFDVFLVLGGFE